MHLGGAIFLEGKPAHSLGLWKVEEGVGKEPGVSVDRGHTGFAGVCGSTVEAAWAKLSFPAPSWPQPFGLCLPWGPQDPPKPAEGQWWVGWGWRYFPGATLLP